MIKRRCRLSIYRLSVSFLDLFTDDESSCATQRVENPFTAPGEVTRPTVFVLFVANSFSMLESGGFCSVKTGSGGDGAPPSGSGAVPTCPACGAAMVLRTAAKGANTGNHFWGCSNYPACRKVVKTVEGLNR